MGGVQNRDNSTRTNQGTFSTTGVATVTVEGGKVTVNVVTGELTFTPSDTTKASTTLQQNQAGTFEGGAVTALMSTTQALSQNTNSAFSQVVERALLQTVAAVAALASQQPNNQVISSLLNQIVTQVTTTAANAGNTILVTNIVAFAVANAPAGQRDAIVGAANTGVQNSTASAEVKSSLNTVVASAAVSGDTLRAQNQFTSVITDTATGNVITPIDPAAVAIVSPSGGI